MASFTRDISRIVVLILALGMCTSSAWTTPAATAAPGVERARLAQPATEIFDFLQITIADSGGDPVDFPPGQEVCLSVTINPPLTPGGTPWITHCYGQVPSQTLHANAPARPFLRSSSYSIAVASNNTGCTVSTPAMTPADYGPGSGWYAIFNVTVDCPDTPVPPTATLVPPTATLVPPTATLAPPTATLVPPTATLMPPTATLAATSTTVPTATIVPSDTYDLVLLWFNPVGSTPPVLPGEVCARIVADPPIVGTSLYDFCSTNSSTNTAFAAGPGESFPTSSTYTAVVVSNASGCLVTTNPLREGRGDTGFLGIIDVMIDCGSIPDPTATATIVPTATLVPSPTPTVPLVPSPTATEPASLTPTATLAPSPTATAPDSSTPTTEPTTPATEPATATVAPTGTPLTPVATTPARTDPAPTSTVKPTNVSVVTSLPTTGSGPLSDMSEALLILAGGLLLAGAALSVSRSQSKR